MCEGARARERWAAYSGGPCLSLWCRCGGGGEIILERRTCSFSMRLQFFFVSFCGELRRLLTMYVLAWTRSGDISHMVGTRCCRCVVKLTGEMDTSE